MLRLISMRPLLFRSALFCGVAVAAGTVSAQDRPSQVIVLKDPTPREPDLQKRFPTKAAPADPALLANYNRQRLQLTQRASAHMRTLATALQSALTQKQVAARLSQEASVAEAIETLAGNVNTAMGSASAPAHIRKSSDLPAATDSPAPPEDLAVEMEHLAALTSALQADVSRSSVDTIQAGVLIKSAQIQRLAHDMKLRLQADGVQH